MNINFDKLKENRNGWWLALDMFMLFMILINLIWMIFDFSFTAKFFQVFLSHSFPSFFTFYRDVVHPDFLYYDFFFVTIFIAEFLFRWGNSIFKKEFDSWVAFPFIYWYDLLGCIPFGSFRFLRLFRIISLTVRLQKREIIDVTHTWWYLLGNRYFYIFVEEVSDRVVANVLTGVQKEMEYGEETVSRIVQEVIVPNQDKFAEWISSRMQFAISETYLSHKADFRTYVDDVVQDAVDQNQELQRLEMIPIFGKQISKALSSSIADISFSVIEQMMLDLSDVQSKQTIKKAITIGVETAVFKTENSEVEQIATDIIHQTIEVLKEQVNKKHHE